MTRESSLTPRDPFDTTMGAPFGRLFEDFFGRTWLRPDGGDRMVAPALDIAEDEHAYRVTVELPGLTKDEVQIQFEDGVLSISGEKKMERAKEGKNWHRIERRYGSFYRAVTLPAGVTVEKAEASMADGILTVTVPKSEEAKPKSIRIK